MSRCLYTEPVQCTKIWFSFVLCWEVAGSSFTDERRNKSFVSVSVTLSLIRSLHLSFSHSLEVLFFFVVNLIIMPAAKSIKHSLIFELCVLLSLLFVSALIKRIHIHTHMCRVWRLVCSETFSKVSFVFLLLFLFFVKENFHLFFFFVNSSRRIRCHQHRNSKRFWLLLLFSIQFAMMVFSHGFASLDILIKASWNVAADPK